MRKRRLPQPRQTIKKHMLERFSTLLGGFNLDFQVILNLVLTNQVFERFWAQRNVRQVFRLALTAEHTIVFFCNHRCYYT